MFGTVMVQVWKLQRGARRVVLISLASRWVLEQYGSRFTAQNPCSQIGVLKVHKHYRCLRTSIFLKYGTLFSNAEYPYKQRVAVVRE